MEKKHAVTHKKAKLNPQQSADSVALSLRDLIQQPNK